MSVWPFRRKPLPPSYVTVLDLAGRIDSNARAEERAAMADEMEQMRRDMAALADELTVARIDAQLRALRQGRSE